MLQSLFSICALQSLMLPVMAIILLLCSTSLRRILRSAFPMATTQRVLQTISFQEPLRTACRGFHNPPTLRRGQSTAIVYSLGTGSVVQHGMCHEIHIETLP